MVVALPHYCTEDVLPAGTLASHVRPSELGSSPIVNVHVHFDRRVTDHAFLAGLGTEAQWVFDRTASSGATTRAVPGCFAIGGGRSCRGPARRPDPPCGGLASGSLACGPAGQRASFARNPGAPCHLPGYSRYCCPPRPQPDPAARARAGRRMDGHGVATNHGRGRAQRGQRRPSRARRNRAAKRAPATSWRCGPERGRRRSPSRSAFDRRPPRGANRRGSRGPPNDKANQRHGTGEWSHSGARPT